MTGPLPDEQRRIVNRLRRAGGQLNAVVAALEDGGTCRTVVPQLAAVTSALHKAGLAIVSSTMKDCLADPTGSGRTPDGMTTEELEKLFLKLT